MIGGIFGHKRGAAEGAVAGAGAGTAVQMTTKGQAVVIPAETVMAFVMRVPLTL
jgi:tRNA A37 threonylcarbamoyladenosine synthetase subunit TsaC/SUA5/YrdC